MSATVLNFENAVRLVQEGKPISEVTAQLVATLTTAERISLLTGPVGFWPGLAELFSTGLNQKPYELGSIKRLGIPGIRFCDGPRGVVLGDATCFPVSMARGATWDTSLEAKVGAVIARESRAKGANTSGSVCINLPRHPAWGRIQETYGEDPIILGQFGAALARSLQDNGVIACVKHYALNSMENTRFHVDVKVDDAALHEVFLPHFEMVVREGGALSIMSAYNAVNGEWCGQHDILLNKILRDMWKFQGFVISDWIFGLRESVKSLKNGLDLEAPFMQVRSKMEKELKAGKISIKDIDRSASRLLSAQLHLYSERSTPDPDPSVVLCDEHRELAREVAARSMVLLKNNPIKESKGLPLLPIDLHKVKRAAVIGVLAEAKNTGDWGSSRVTSPHVITPAEGITSALPNADVKVVASDSISEAVKAASGADFVVVVVGYGATDEGENLSANNPMNLIPFPTLGEIFTDAPRLVYKQMKERLGITKTDGPSIGGNVGGDRKSLRLCAKNLKLIRAVKKANPNTIVSIITSGAIIMEEWVDDVDTLLVTWYSGCEGGHALADVIFGQTDASGRLPFSVPRSEEHLPVFDPSAKKVTYDKWFGQRLLDQKQVEARFPLGYGCSYTKCEISDLQVSKADGALDISCNVRNIGQRAGRYVAQAYGCMTEHVVDFPPKVLLGFSPVDLDAGQSSVIRFKGYLRPLQRWADGKFVFASKAVKIQVGSHACDGALTTSLQLG